MFSAIPRIFAGGALLARGYHGPGLVLGEQWLYGLVTLVVVGAALVVSFSPFFTPPAAPTLASARENVAMIGVRRPDGVPRPSPPATIKYKAHPTSSLMWYVQCHTR